MDQIRRHVRGKAEQILELTDGDDQRDADREAFDDRLRNQRDEPSGPHEARLPPR